MHTYCRIANVEVIPAYTQYNNIVVYTLFVSPFNSSPMHRHLQHSVTEIASAIFGGHTRLMKILLRP